jgi:hypothetical protein
MSFAVVQNGAVRQLLQMDMPFTVGDKTYSSNFLRSSTSQEKLEAGVWEIIEGTRADDRFYWVSPASHRVNEVNSTVEATYAATAKQLDDTTETPEGATEPVTTKGLKSQWVAATKDTANKLMASTDWMVIRKVERNVDIPAATATYRAAVIAECTRLVAAINAAADVPALVAVLEAQNWPQA